MKGIPDAVIDRVRKKKVFVRNAGVKGDAAAEAVVVQPAHNVQE